jgi:TolB-like protein
VLKWPTGGIFWPGNDDLLYRFAEFVLDTDRRELWRGPHPVTVAPQVFDLLEYLIKNRNRVVSKEDLIAAIWDGRIVSETALSTRINAVRCAIDDTGEDQRLVRTLPRRGVRFVGKVHESQELQTQAVAGAIEQSGPALTLPDRPSIAVLPFTNLSADLEQEYFADGMVEDIITELSRVRWLFVIARNSSFTYKGRPVDARQVSRELGVRYTLEGSVRKSANRMRVSVQLVDAVAGHHVWAQRYDRELAGIFALQDEITERVVAAVEPQLYIAEGIRAKRKRPESLDAWECVVRALSYINSRSPNDYAMASKFLERAIELDPVYAQAYALFAYIKGLEVLYGWKPREFELARSLDAAQKAVVLDNDDAWAHFALGFVYGMTHRAEEAVVEHEKALALNPNFALGYTYLAAALAYLGRSKEALLKIDMSERLSPRGLFRGVNSVCRALAHFSERQTLEAISCARKSILESPGIVTGYRMLVVNYVLAGEIDEARSALEIVKRLQPDVSLKWITDSVLFTRDRDQQDIVEGFRLAGLE